MDTKECTRGAETCGQTCGFLSTSQTWSGLGDDLELSTSQTCGQTCGHEKAFIYAGFPQHPQVPQVHYEHLLIKGKNTRKTRVYTHIRVYSSFLETNLWMLWNERKRH